MRSGLFERERDGEYSPGRVGTDEPDSPAVRLSDVVHDRQPKAGAALSERPSLSVNPKKEK